MAFSKDTIDSAWRRTDGICECTRNCPKHTGQRCDIKLTAGKWHAHHKVSQKAGGSDSLSNCEALCIPCHQNTGSYGG